MATGATACLLGHLRRDKGEAGREQRKSQRLAANAEELKEIDAIIKPCTVFYSPCII